MEVLNAKTESVESFFQTLNAQNVFPDVHIAQDDLREACRSFEFPTTRDEQWKYTRVTKISNKSFSLGLAGDVEEIASKIEVKENQIVLVNGVFAQEYSSIPTHKGLDIFSSFEELLEDEFPYTDILEVHENIFTIANLAYPTSGLVLAVEENVIVETPITILHVSTGKAILGQPQFTISLANGASLKVEQNFISIEANECLVNSTLVSFVGQNAQLKITKTQKLDATSMHIANEYIALEKDSTITFNTITTDGLLTRNNLTVEVNGTNCNTNLNGVYDLDGQKLVDNHTVVDHKAPHCESNELYKGVLNGKATAVFNGKVFVRKNAQKINAFQKNGTILLSDDAQMNSKPELEIYADDVKCSHGCTTGQLNEEAIFYLRARGIGELSAKKLMVEAFIGEVYERMTY
jgi:Fe-S cluster assembly protein SufD